MLRFRIKSNTALNLLLLCALARAGAQTAGTSAQISMVVVDENGLAVPDAQVTVSEPGQMPVQARTDYAGRCSYAVHQALPYSLRVEKPGFYQRVEQQTDARTTSLEVQIAHVQDIPQQVTVTASSVNIDPERTADTRTFNTPEIVNIPYTTSRDIRRLLPFIPGIVQDASGQVHVAGAETYQTLYLLDGFDIRSPVEGTLSMRFSTDAVRSIDTLTTRYPVEFGRATGGVIAFTTGMGDNKFHFNVTNFLPSFRQKKGLRFDKFVPRVTFSGPLVRDRAWFFDGAELEADNTYIPELPAGANTNHLMRGSNLWKAQVNVTPANILSGGLLFNYFHSPYDALSSLRPQQSTTREQNSAWFSYIRDQHSFAHGELLDVAAGWFSFRNTSTPHTGSPFTVTPEGLKGSYFEDATERSHREEVQSTLYLRPHRWVGRHELKTGASVDHIGFRERLVRAPVSYLREDGTLLRRSVFPLQGPFGRNNLEVSAFLQDRWSPHAGLLLEPGLRFDWDEILRRPLFSPRLAGTYSLPGAETTTKISAGVGLYYERTQLEYLTRALAGIREDTLYAQDGTTPLGGPVRSIFTADPRGLRQTRALNWSIGLERKLPGSIYASVNFIQKRVSDGLVYAHTSGLEALGGEYSLSNQRRDTYHSFEVDARHTFAGGYTLFGSYTRSSARTNAALDYQPALSLSGPQQAGPLPWDTPNRVVSWGWLPLLVPRLRNNWDFVYTLDWRSGFSFTAVDAGQQVVGPAGAQRFPCYLSFNPGLEWRFHFRGSYFGLRGVYENATGSSNALVVNNVVGSPQYGIFSQPQGRALTARLRLIESK